MLYSIKIKNFYSIGDEQFLDFTSPKDDDASVIKTKFGKVNKVVSIVGNNASGKTNLLRVFTFLHWLAHASITEESSEISYYKHFLMEDLPSEIEVVFQAFENLFKLKFVFDYRNIIYEKLSIKKKKNDSFKQVYKVTRENDEFKTSYSEYLEKLNYSERLHIKGKRNASMFSYLCIMGKLKKLGINRGISELYRSNLRNMGVSEVNFGDTCKNLSKYFIEAKNKDEKDIIIKILRTMDLGILDIADTLSIVTNTKIHSKLANYEIINLLHGNDEKKFDVPLLLESEGTVESMEFIIPLLQVISQDGMFVIDEIERSKHPLIVKELISIFINNNSNSQLIFSTHLPLLLENRNKSQIVFVEKTDCINSEIYRLEDLKNVRNVENFSLKYVTGKYGAIPRKKKCPNV